ncbi:MAG TPA: methyltransferase domain-containing protein [bacterium]|nr:methyltransferase domain-containing protein [bacterium]
MTDQVETATSVDTARDYYNSGDADNFYHTIWGGEDIHVGLYRSDDESIFQASRRTIEQMASRLHSLNEDARVLDLGAGYGGAARYLANEYGCEVVALNLSEVENERDRTMNKAQSLDHLIEVVDGNFEDIPYDDNTFDIVWSQDSFLHSAERGRILQEAAGVLKDGGELIFTDPMAANDCPGGVLQPILDRIHLEDLASPAFYQETAEEVGLREIGFQEETQQLITHYSRVLEETERREDEIRENVSQDYIDHMKEGLEHWINGGEKGYLAWGIFHFQK